MMTCRSIIEILYLRLKMTQSRQVLCVILAGTLSGCGLQGTEVGNGKRPERSDKKSGAGRQDQDPETAAQNSESPKEQKAPGEGASDTLKPSTSGAETSKFAGEFPQLFNDCASPFAGLRTIAENKVYTVTEVASQLKIKVRRATDKIIITDQDLLVYQISLSQQETSHAVNISDATGTAAQLNYTCQPVASSTEQVLNEVSGTFTKYSSDLSKTSDLFELIWYTSDPSGLLSRIELKTRTITKIFIISAE